MTKDELDKAIMEYAELLAKKEYDKAEKLAKEIKKTPEGEKLLAFMGVLEESAHRVDAEFDQFMVDIREYGRTIKKDGWKAGEPVIEAGVKKYGPDFKKWTHAVGIMLRADELINE